ncbi:MAG: hypothetical protein ABIQ32_08940 [Sphingomicrobium sp.]
MIRVAGLTVALILAGCSFDPQDDGRPQQVTKSQSGVALSFGNVEMIKGTRFFTIPIRRAVNDGKSYGSFSGDFGEERNRLIVDSSTGENRRVLPDETAALVNWIVPTSSPVNNDLLVISDGPPTTANPALDAYAAVVKRPGKSDKDASHYDLLAGHFTKADQKWIARGLDGVQTAWISADSNLAVVAASKGRGIYTIYDGRDFRQVLQRELKIAD